MDITSISGVIASLITLTFLEIILGVDNLIFISISSNRLPLHKQKKARRFGLLLALVTRLLLLAGVVWITTLTKPWFSIFQQSISARDLLLIGGGLFLLFKATLEIHTEFEDSSEQSASNQYRSLIWVVIQIAVLDIVFSFDSVLTAIGLTQQYWIMATAIVIAIILMVIASEPLSHFVNRHPTIKMLALSFLLLIGIVLIADGLQFHIPRGYIYFAICFSVVTEILNNTLARKKRNRKKLD